MIDGAPQVMRLAINLHKDLIEVPLPLVDLAYIACPADADLSSEHRPKTINPEPYALMANVDAAFMQQIFHIPQRQRKANVHHHCELNDLGRCFEISKRISGHPVKLADLTYPLNHPVALTMPRRRLEVAEWSFGHAAESRTVGMPGSSLVLLTLPSGWPTQAKFFWQYPSRLSSTIERNGRQQPVR